LLISIAAAGVSATFCSRKFHPIRCGFIAAFSVRIRARSCNQRLGTRFNLTWWQRDSRRRNLLGQAIALVRVERATTHGFRAVASTILNESNLFNRDWIERQLAHVERNEVRRAYNAAEWMPDRDLASAERSGR